MATIKAVARKAKVSAGTVSNVLSGSVPVSEELRQRVLAAVSKMHYVPNHVARSLKIRQTHTLGMVISDITNPFFPQLVRGAEDAALERGYLIITFNTDDRLEREKQVLGVLRSRRVDGILLVVAPNHGKVGHIKEVIASGIPVIAVDRVPSGVSVDSVTVDNANGAREAVEHLIAAGHRRIGMIGGARTLQTARERLQGYESALRGAGIPVLPALIRAGDYRAESGFRMALKLLKGEHRPSAIFTANGMLALGALRALGQLGLRCPDDVALASFDDLLVAGVFHPHLTSVAQPAYEMGRQAAEMLIGRIEGRLGDTGPREIRLKTTLHVRESSGQCG